MTPRNEKGGPKKEAVPARRFLEDMRGLPQEAAEVTEPQAR